MKKLIITICIVLISRWGFANSQTVTSYYPSPFGVYYRLQIEPKDSGYVEDPNCIIGTMYVTNAGVLKTCQDDGAGGTMWGLLGSTYWTENNNALFPKDFANSSLKIGIGTSEPTAMLSIGTVEKTHLDFDFDASGNSTINHVSNGSLAPGADFTIYRDDKPRLSLLDEHTFFSSQDDDSLRFTQGSGADELSMRYGRVGVNGFDDAASYDLQVFGNGQIGISSTNPILYFADDNDDDFRIEAKKNHKLQFRGEKTESGWGNLMVIDYNANIGILEYEPSHELEVVGPINSTGFRLNGNLMGSGIWSKNGNKIYKNNALVGINEKSASASLEINGQVDIDVKGGSQFVVVKEGDPLTDGAMQISAPSSVKIYRTNFHFGQHKNGFRILDKNGNLFFKLDGKNYKVEMGPGTGSSEPSHNFVVHGTAGKPGGGPWDTTSDRRLKKNIQTLQGSLDKMLSLEGVTFKWKNPENHGDANGVQLGMIAQDVEKVFPEWVGEMPDGYKDLTVRGFEALTVESFRELKQSYDKRKKYYQDKLDQLKKIMLEQQKIIYQLEN